MFICVFVCMCFPLFIYIFLIYFGLEWHLTAVGSVIKQVSTKCQTDIHKADKMRHGGKYHCDHVSLIYFIYVFLCAPLAFLKISITSRQCIGTT